MKFFTILQDRSKTNVFISNCVEEEKRKNEASFFWGEIAKKNEYNRSSTIEDLPLLPLAVPTKQTPTTPPPTHWPSQWNKHQQHRRLPTGCPNEQNTNNAAADSLAVPMKQAPTTPPSTNWPPQRNNHQQHRRRHTGRRDFWSLHGLRSRPSRLSGGGEKFPFKH